MKRTPLLTVPLITDQNRKAFFWPMAFYLYFSYTLSGFNPFFEPWHPRVTQVDLAIPFLEETVWVYLSHIGMLFTGWWWMKGGHACTRQFYAVMLCTVLATCYFLLYPTQIDRITLAAVRADPLTTAAWAFLLSADKPTNCFPSMHVALSTLTAVGLSRASPHWRILAPLWAAGIAITTMTTRQHVLLDVLGGLGLALFCWWVAEKFVAVEGESVAVQRNERGEPA